MIKPLKTIFFATNLSESCASAFELAAGLAIRYQATLVLLHVVEKAPDYVEGRLKALLGEKEWNEMMFSSAYTLNHVKYILATKGSKGMTLMDNENEKNVDIESEPVAVYNVSGAGDTVVAVMAACLSMGIDPLKSARVANKCAGYVVTQPGTSVVPKNFFDVHVFHSSNTHRARL